MPPLPWIRKDTIIISALIVAAIATRFWHLGNPPEIVFDEVHFVGQARHYLHGEPFLDPHPPVAKMLITLGIWLFGDHPWSWRIGNAVLGTVLVGVTYLLGLRLFKIGWPRRWARRSSCATGCFWSIRESECIDIVYLTFAAISYLLLFRFMQTEGALAKRKLLLWMGIALGLCLGSKLYIPAVACVLVAAFVAFDVWKMEDHGDPALGQPSNGYRERRALAAVVTLASVTAIFYLSTFLLHYILGWWGGVSDLFDYYKNVIWYENSVSSATHPYSSPWWSWPMMLRPVAYWQNFPKEGKVATVWGGGNPLIWWGALTGDHGRRGAMPSSVRRERAIFMLSGYLGYVLMWVWIGRTLFLYHYMPAVYLGFLALAAVLAECWYGRAELWEHAAILLTIAPALILGLGPLSGWISVFVLAAVYGALLFRWPSYSGKFVCVTFVAGAAILFVYFFPVWTAIPIERAGYYARMWLSGPGIRNWI